MSSLVGWPQIDFQEWTLYRVKYFHASKKMCLNSLVSSNDLSTDVLFVIVQMGLITRGAVC